MIKRFVFLFLFCLFASINANVFKEPGKYVENYVKYPEKNHYKKVSLERDVDNRHFMNKYQDKDFQNHKENDEWFDEKKYMAEKYSTNYQKIDKKPEVEFEKKIDGSYDGPQKEKYNKFPKKYDVEHKKDKQDRPEFHKIHQDPREKEDHMRHIKINPPDHTKYLAMARYVVHLADWSAVATVSTLSSVKGFPFSNVVSMSDGPIKNSTGIPYFYLTPLDFTHQDISKDNRCTVSVSLAETGYCSLEKWEADDPRCSRVMLSGKIQRVSNTSREYDFAKNALFTRHPSMAHLPSDHNFYVAKLKISHIVMLDWFGGPKFIDVRDYINYKPISVNKDHVPKERAIFNMDTNSIDQEYDVLP